MWGTHEIGTTGHLLVSLVAETVIEKMGITVRTVPSGTYVGRAWSARLGDTHTTIEMSPGAKFLQEGMFEYAGYDWGPQKIRYIFLPQHVGHALAVNADSDILSGEQLKGKKIARIPGSSAFDQTTMAMLAFFDVWEKDVENINFPSPGAGWKGQMEGRVDSLFWNVVAPTSYELAAAQGIRWLEMDPNDTEGWARAHKVLPIGPRKATVAAGVPEGVRINVSTSAYPVTAAYDHLDPDIAYWITKAIVELYPDYKAKHTSLAEDWTIDAHWALWEADVVPLHEGAVRYFKDAGMWNDAREKMQQERLKHQDDLAKLWDKIKTEALDLKIKEKDFPKYWLEQKALAGF